MLTQTLTITLGHGRAITVTSEADTVVVTGTFDVSTPVWVNIPLLPNTTHHLLVKGQVEYATGCFYTLGTTFDRNGSPLIIVQNSTIATPTSTPTLTPQPTPTICPDLLDPPGVGLEDIQVVATHWGQSYDPLYDLNTDQQIDIADVQIASAHWGENCRPP